MGKLLPAATSNVRYAFLLMAFLGALFGMPVQAGDSPLALCVECHQSEGALAAQLPRIEGQHAEYLAREIEHFQDAHREGFPMRIIASTLPRAQIKAIASELAARPWDRRPELFDSIAAKAGAPLASALACSGCHGPAFRGAAAVPRLAGQNPEYLARQLRAFDHGHRQLSLPEAAVSMKGLSAAETHALAHYLASLDGDIHLGWLRGHWCSASASDRSEAWWSDARGGLLVGMQRDLSDARPASFVFGRIEIGAGNAVYHYQASGRPALTFTLIEAGERFAVFSNPKNSYPRRLRYQRNGDVLKAELDDGRGDAVLSFAWMPQCTGAAL